MKEKTGLAVACVLVIFVAPKLLAHDGPDGIILPSATSPARIGQGEPFFSIAKMRLPLTPPPGVQQPTAKEGWAASLLKTGVSPNLDGSNEMIFQGTIIRYRPDSNDRYRVTIKPNPWTPPGIYDLVLRGPGLKSRCERCVEVAMLPKKNRLLEMDRLGLKELRATNPFDEPLLWHLDLLIPPDITGLAVWVDGQDATPDWVGFVGDAPEDGLGTRVLHFQIPVPKSEDGNPAKRTAVWEETSELACSAAIKINAPGGNIDPTLQTSVSFEIKKPTSFAPTSFSWNFGDDAKGVGRETTHLFILNHTVDIRGFAFDRFGRVCAGHTKARVARPLDRTACGCEAPGVPNQSLLGALLKMTI